MRTSFPGSTLATYDPETTNGFEGRLPGTVSLLGYGVLYLDQQLLDFPPIIPSLVTATTPLPTIPLTTISIRIADIRDFGPSAIGTTAADSYNKLRSIIGPERSSPFSSGR